MAQLTCFVRSGDDPLRISWFLKGAVVSSDPSVTTTMIGTRASMLMITNVGYRHSGTYTCKASNDAGTEDVSATLKVNGTLGVVELREKLITLGTGIYCKSVP